MSVTTEPKATTVTVSPRHLGRAVSVPNVSATAIGVAGVAVGFLVARDGSPVWQVVRTATILVAACLSIYLVRWGPGWPRGVACYLWGIAATATGAAIGLGYLSKAGWSPVTVAGLLALIAGVVLLLSGAAVIVGRTHRWWRLPMIPVLLVITVVSLWSGILAVAATNVPPTALGAGTSAHRGLSYQDVTYSTSDGVRLSAWYVPSANRAAVVVLHGAGSTRAAVIDHAVVLVRHGYGVLMPDARGHGRSGGRAMDFGWYGDRDITAAVSFLQTRPDVDRTKIAAIGLSMGGEEAIGAAATDARIRAVVAEGATNRVAADRVFLAEAYGVRGHVQNGIDALTYGLTDLLTAADPPITLRAGIEAAAPRPFLLITAGNVPTERYAARHLQRGHANVQVWQAPGTAHTGSLYTHPGEWERTVTAFLAGSLN